MSSVTSARVFQVACAALMALALSALPVGATSRIKDLANIEGVRQNQLIGYGLVVGLNGTGDTLNNIPFTKQSLQAMLERMGVNIRGATIRTGNVAAVMVTGNLPRLRHPGHADGRHGFRARRFQESAGRHPARHPPARRRRQRLCGGAGLGRGRRLCRRGCSRQRHPRRADGRPHRQRRHHRTRDRVRAQPPAQCAAGAAQRRFHHRQAHRRRGQRFPRRQDRRTDRSLHRAAFDPPGVQGQCRRLPDRDRTAAGRS